MAERRLTFEHGQVRLGSHLIPGILRDMSVRGEIRWDEAQVDAGSGKQRVPLGWKDADVLLTLDLLTDDDSDCYTKLSGLNRIFKGHDGTGDPNVYDVAANPHLSARGIDQVVFSGLDSYESDQEDVLICTLNFIEHGPAVVEAEQRAAASADSAAAPDVAPVASTEPDPQIVKDDVNPFAAGFDAGYS